MGKVVSGDGKAAHGGHRVAYMREMVYAVMTGLAIVSAFQFEEHANAADAFWSLALGIVGISLAGFVAEVVAFQISNSTPPRGAELRSMMGIAGSALLTASPPLATLALAAMDAIDLGLALQLSVGIYFATLIVTVLVASRRAGLPRRSEMLALAVLIALAVAVVATLAIAHL